MGYGDNFNAEEDQRECEAMRKMFVGGLNRQTDTETFKNHFSQFGNIVDCVIIIDPNTKVSRGFGFVTYENSESVDNCFSKRPHNVDGKSLDTKRAIPREFNNAAAHQRVKKLFIGGVPAEMESHQIQEYIESRHPKTVGQIESIDLLKDKVTNKNKGFGFITCDTEDFADRLIISETSFKIDGKQMSIKKAEPKEGLSGSGRGGRGGGRGGRGGSRGGGYNQGGYNQGGYNQGGYNQGGYNQGGYNQGGYNQGGYNQGGYNQGGYNQGSYGGQNSQQESYGNQGGYGGNAGNQQYPTAYPSQQSYSGDYSGGNTYNAANSYNAGPSRGGQAASRGGNRYAPY